LIYSTDPEDYTDYINQVLQYLREYRLYIKPSKYIFYTNKVELLGFVINTKGIVIELSRVETICD
jgi:hypothetical protein